MEEYHIAICDDESADRERLKELIQRSPLCPQLLIFHEYSGGEALIENYEKFDAVILDISMDAMDGRETARAVRRMDDWVLLAFYTGLEEYASRLIPVHPFVYLNKQDGEEALSGGLNLLLEEMIRRYQFPRLPVMGDGRLLLLPPSDILYITIRGKGSELWLTEKACRKLNLKEQFVKSSIRLPDYYEELKKYGFIYAHRSYIVNAEHLIMRNPGSIVLEGGCELNVARSRQKEFDRELSRFLGIRYKRGERQ
ncbi:MAG: LytTR family DNA-binding domain-containing protein [Clostridium sp.]|nr:LytTR family DNA-binding domain-containing protein [Clostridium sp.]